MMLRACVRVNCIHNELICINELANCLINDCHVLIKNFTKNFMFVMLKSTRNWESMDQWFTLYTNTDISKFQIEPSNFEAEPGAWRPHQSLTLKHFNSVSPGWSWSHTCVNTCLTLVLVLQQKESHVGLGRVSMRMQGTRVRTCTWIWSIILVQKSFSTCRLWVGISVHDPPLYDHEV